MKKLLFLTLLMLSVVGARAQQPSFIEFFGDYAVREGFTSVELGRRMMQMMTRQAGTDASLAQLLQGISSIRIIVADTLDRDFVAAAREVADKAPYQLLSSLSEEGQTARCYLAEGGRNGESEFLMVTYGPKETVVNDVVGTFDVTEVSRLSSFRPR